MEKPRIMSVRDYYGDDGAREICHLIKEGDMKAICEAAHLMATYVGKGDILVPVPSRTGRATVTLSLCTQIARISGCRVSDIIGGRPRESLYVLKLSGSGIPDFDPGFFIRRRIPHGRLVLVDNVYDTGTTARLALEAVGKADVLVFARVGIRPAALPQRSAAAVRNTDGR